MLVFIFELPLVSRTKDSFLSLSSSMYTAQSGLYVLSIYLKLDCYRSCPKNRSATASTAYLLEVLVAEFELHGASLLYELYGFCRVYIHDECDMVNIIGRSRVLFRIQIMWTITSITLKMNIYISLDKLLSRFSLFL